MELLLKRFIRSIRRYGSRIFSPSEDNRILQVSDTIEKVELLKSLTRGHRRHLARAIHDRSYQPDEVIYYQGDPGLGMYIIEEGEVELIVEDDGDEPVRTAGPFECFGSLGLLGDFSRLETARAKTNISIYGLFRPDLRTLFRRHPKSGIQILSALAQHHASLELELIEQLSQQGDRANVLRTLYQNEQTPDHVQRSEAPRT